MPCRYCNSQFTITRWKSTCDNCMKKYCSECMIGKNCKSCNNVKGTNFKRQNLMEVKIKDLRLYLSNRNCSTEHCKEKVELIKLIQQCHNVYEPDLQIHTESYSTTVKTTLGPEPQSSSSNSNFSRPDFYLPTYQQTQESFPTAQEFSNFTPSTTQNLSPSNDRLKAKENVDLADLKSVEDILHLSSKQLKLILKNNFVNFHGVLEKSELVKRVETLYLQHKKDSETFNTEKTFVSENYEENLCKICLDNPVNCVFLECGHMMTCIDCSKSIKECPICRQHISRTVRVFKS